MKRPVEKEKDDEAVDGTGGSLFSKQNEEKLTVCPKLAAAIFLMYSNLSTDQISQELKPENPQLWRLNQRLQYMSLALLT